MTEEVRRTSPPATSADDYPAGEPRINQIIDSALQRSLDEAFREAGLTVAPDKKSIFEQRFTRQVSVEIEKSTEAFYQGPMPPPAMLKTFEEVVPGLAKQIAVMAQAEQNHRHTWERRALWNDIFAQSGGLFSAGS